MSLLDALVQQGALKDTDLPSLVKTANEKYGGDLDTALTDFGVSKETLLSFKSNYYGLPFRDVDAGRVVADVLKYIPEDAARHYQFIPIALHEGVLEVGIVDPEDTAANNALQFITSKSNVPYKLFLISKANFERIVENYKGLTGEVEAAISEIDSELADVDTSGVEIISHDTTSNTDEAKIVEDAPIIKIVAVILRHATEGNASDIHIESTGDKVKVRFRLDGILHTSLILPLNVFAGIVARIKILAKLRLDEKRKPQDGSFATRISGRKVEFRVSTFPSYYGEKVVMRILDPEKGIRNLDSLALTEDNLALVKEALARPFGLVLITGPTGSGKSTTLYSMLNALDRERYNVVSLEDPVEYQIPDVSQSQVMPEIGYTFANGLRSILRQDPDMIMVGEIRDKETAQLAIQAALTGHLVFSTLHTNNAVGVIPRLIDMGVDPYLIAPTLVLAIAQRLARIVCPESRQKVPIDEATKTLIDKQFADATPEVKKKYGLENITEKYNVVPSAECPTGTRGRIAVFEMFKVGKEMQKVILTNPIESEIWKVARAQGMLTMKEDAIIKSLKGELPFEEVYSEL